MTGPVTNQVHWRFRIENGYWVEKIVFFGKFAP